MHTDRNGIILISHQHIRKVVSFFTLTLFLFSSFLILNQTSEAQLLCPMRAVELITTQDGESSDPSISADGTRIAFQTRQNINGGNPDGSLEIFLFDTITRVFIQITDDPSEDSTQASINADGTRIAFRSESNINGGNPDGTREIFIFDTTTGIFTQITDSPTENSDDPSINADGTRVAFVTNANINGGNPENNDEIFLFDTTSGIFTQITNTLAGDNEEPSVNADGTRVAFRSDANINGLNPGAIRQIFLFSQGGGIVAITSEPAGESESPSINADGTRIAFESTANINGGNADGNDEVFLFDTTTGIFTQITDEPFPRNSSDPSINADGTRIAFESTANINGGNPENNEEVYIFETTTAVITQITQTPSGNSDDASISADGLRIAFESFANINGDNPNMVNQIWLARCMDASVGRPIPTLSEWGLIAMAGVLGIAILIALRTRKIAT